jgi:hypothetical protein
MRVRCAWCGADMANKEDENGSDLVSHSICRNCSVKVMADLDSYCEDQEKNQVRFDR